MHSGIELQGREQLMKSFKSFHLDTANHILWRNGERVPITPKAFDVLAYLVEHAGQLVTQDDILEALWSETYVNPEVLRKYILEVRKALGDRPDKPEYVETLPKRGYRFVAQVTDESTAAISATEKRAGEATVGSPKARSDRGGSNSGHRLWRVGLLLGVMTVVAAAAVSGYLRFTRQRAYDSSRNNNTSIAVLPFTDMSPAKDQEYFSDGLSEELINDLAKVSGLKVVGRSSSFQFRGKNEDLRVIGRKLGVANVLEGSVRREGKDIRITAELIKADDGFQLWSQTYDREAKDIFAVQDEIAQATTQALQLKLLGSNGQPVTSNYRSANPDAYRDYLQARYFIARGASKEDLDKALAFTNKSIELDEHYAPAWALRATVQNTMATVSLIDVTEGFRNAREAAERAIALDPTSASAYISLAATHIFYDWDFDAASTCITKATALEPSNADVLLIGSRLSQLLGNLDQAIRLGKQAIALDPLDATARLQLGYVLYVAGRDDEAEAELRKTLDLHPETPFAHATLGDVLIAKQMPQRALAEIEKEPSEWERLTAEVLVYHALGREHDSNAALTKLIQKHHTDSAFQIAEGYAFRGESDKAFEWLERAYKQRDAGLPEMKTDPLLNNLHHDPRYAALLSKLRIPA